jgi:hypothetical protein
MYLQVSQDLCFRYIEFCTELRVRQQEFFEFFLFDLVSIDFEELKGLIKEFFLLGKSQR